MAIGQPIYLHFVPILPLSGQTFLLNTVLTYYTYYNTQTTTLLCSAMVGFLQGCFPIVITKKMGGFGSLATTQLLMGGERSNPTWTVNQLTPTTTAPSHTLSAALIGDHLPETAIVGERNIRRRQQGAAEVTPVTPIELHHHHC